jgi:hypothetical protein
MKKKPVDSPLRVEALPPDHRGRPRSGPAVEEMLKFVREAQGQWCRVLERDNYSTANSVAARWRLSFGAQGYEFRLRRLSEGQKEIAVVYARFTGGK